MIPIFKVGELVVINSKVRPSFNGTVVQIKAITQYNNNFAYRTQPSLTQAKLGWAETALRKIPRDLPCKKSFKQLIKDLKEGKTYSKR